MNKIISVLFSGAVLASCAATPYPAVSAEQPNILILGEDADRDTIPRNNRIFKRVLNAISNQLSDEGFNVFDETAVTLDNFVQGRDRRTAVEIIDIAKSIKHPPIDVGVIFTIYSQHKKLTYTAKINTRIVGRLLDIKSGQRLGSFEVKMPEVQNVPRDCDRECLLESVGKQSRELGQDLGAVLTKKLSHLTPGRSKNAHDNHALPTAYTLVFDGFKPEDITEIEEYIVAFRGYQAHRPIRTSQRHAEYWYNSSTTSARLNRNLRKMLEYIGIDGRLTFSGNKFVVEKITLRKN
jgi:hypothetical protein